VRKCSLYFFPSLVLSPTHTYAYFLLRYTNTQSVALPRARARALSLPRFLPLTHMHTFAHLTVKDFHSLHCNTLQHTATHCNILQHNAATQSATSDTHAHARAPDGQGFPLVNSTPLAIEYLLDILTNFDVFIALSPFAAVAPSL